MRVGSLVRLGMVAGLLASVPCRGLRAQTEPVVPRLVRGAAITLKVRDLDASRTRLLQAVQSFDATPLGSVVRVNFQGKKDGWVRFALPAERLQGCLDAVRALGILAAEKVDVRDRTREYEDLKERISHLRAHEKELLETLNFPRRMRGSDILYMQERLLTTRFEISGATQSLLALESSCRTASLVVSLFEPEPRRGLDVGNWYASAALRARTSALRLLAKGVTAGVFALYFSWVWIPALIVLAILGVKLRAWARRLDEGRRPEAPGSPDRGAAPPADDPSQ